MTPFIWSARILAALVMVFSLNGCSAPVTAPTAILPLSHTPASLKPTVSPPNSLATEEEPGTGEAFRFVRNVRVTPDLKFPKGGGGYIHYIPAIDRMVVVMTTDLNSPVKLTTGDVCERKALGYKEYTTDLEPTGKEGYVGCAWGDSTSLMVGSDLYTVSMAGPGAPGQQPWIGWNLLRFDAVTWERLGATDVRLNFPSEQDGGPTLSYVNGKIIATAEYRLEGDLGSGSHNHLFTPDLRDAGKMILTPPEFPVHYCEVAILQESGGDILIFASTSSKGDLMVLRLDKDWLLKDREILRKNAYFPTGAATDGKYFYVAYTDSSTTPPGMAMEGQNIRLAAFDSAWRTIQDVAVSNVQITADESDFGEGPWLALHGRFLYVSYLISRLDPTNHALVDNQAFVSMYELADDD